MRLVTRLLSSRRAAGRNRTFLFVDLNERSRPEARDDLYSDPLDAALKRAGLGEVTGAGTQLSPVGEPLSAGIDVEITSREIAEPVIIRVLEQAGVPRGTFITGGEPPVASAEFGVSEGVAIYLNGTDLPDEVYASSDVNVLIDELAAGLDGLAQVRGWWEGPTETALYVYGRSFGELRDAVRPVLRGHPLGDRARIVDLPARSDRR